MKALRNFTVPAVILTLVVIVAVSGCSGPSSVVATPFPSVVKTADVPTKTSESLLRNFSESAVIYGGVGSARELIYKLDNGDHLSNGQTLHTSQELGKIFKAKTPAFRYGPLVGFGMLTTSGNIVYEGEAIADHAIVTVRRPGVHPHEKEFTEITAAKLLAGYGKSALPVLVYRINDIADPATTIIQAAIVTAGGEIVHVSTIRTPHVPSAVIN